jgi:hypothetical protein
MAQADQSSWVSDDLSARRRELYIGAGRPSAPTSSKSRTANPRVGRNCSELVRDPGVIDAKIESMTAAPGKE